MGDMAAMLKRVFLFFAFLFIPVALSAVDANVTEATSSVASVVALSGPLCVGLAAFGCGIGLGIAVSGAMEALGRQPSASGKILTNMIIGAALIEALAIYALIVFFILLGRMG